MKQTITNKITFLRDHNMPDNSVDSIKHQSWSSEFSLFRNPLKWVKHVTNDFTYIRKPKIDKKKKPGFV